MKKVLTKSQLKEKQIKKDKYKQALKKSFNIVCYICTALFLVMCIALGIGIAKNSKKSNNDNLESSQVLEVDNKLFDSDEGFYFTQDQLDYSYKVWSQYYLNFDSNDFDLLNGVEFKINPYAFKLYDDYRGSILSPVSFNSSSYKLVGIDFYNFPIYVDYSIRVSSLTLANYFNGYNFDTYVYSYYNNNTFSLFQNNSYNLLDRYVFSISNNGVDNSDMDIELTFFDAVNSSEVYLDFGLGNILTGLQTYEKIWIIDDTNRIPYTYNDIVWLISRLLVVSTYNYSFNYNYNPGNIVFNSNGTFYCTDSTLILNTQKLVIDTGWFICNDNYYNQIVFNAAVLGSSTSVTYDGVNVQDYNGTDNFYILGVYFSNSIEGVNITFMSINSIDREGGKAIWLGNYKVYNNLFYDLVFLQPYHFKNSNQSNFIYVNDNVESAFTILNRQPFNSANSGSSIIGGGNNNVFDLFKTGFNSIIPFLSVSILPSITIGVLLFMPLVVGIIVLIFKMVRK